MFLDYDGTLTPIVDRPEEALISESMRDAVRELAARCPVCVVSGRDRRVVQELMGIDDLIVAGSHGFDIWSPAGGEVQREEGEEFADLLEEVEARLREELGAIDGALVEPKKSSVAAHYRLVSEDQRPEVRRAVEEILAGHPGELKVTPGKMVYEVQPNVDWDKEGRPVSARRARPRPRRRGADIPGRRHNRRARVRSSGNQRHRRLRRPCRGPGGRRAGHLRRLRAQHVRGGGTVPTYAGAVIKYEVRRGGGSE